MTGQFGEKFYQCALMSLISTGAWMCIHLLGWVMDGADSVGNNLSLIIDGITLFSSTFLPCSKQQNVQTNFLTSFFVNKCTKIISKSSLKNTSLFLTTNTFSSVLRVFSQSKLYALVIIQWRFHQPINHNYFQNENKWTLYLYPLGSTQLWIICVVYFF